MTTTAVLAPRRRAWAIVVDLLIATALVWALPLAFGVISALVKLVLG